MIRVGLACQPARRCALALYPGHPSNPRHPERNLHSLLMQMVSDEESGRERPFVGCGHFSFLSFFMMKIASSAPDLSCLRPDAAAKLVISAKDGLPALNRA